MPESEADATRWQALKEWLEAQREEAWSQWAAANDAMHAVSYAAWDAALAEVQQCEATHGIYNSILTKMQELENR